MSHYDMAFSAHMDLDDSALPLASSMPLSTIPEVPGDEYEYDEGQDLDRCAYGHFKSFTDDIRITTSIASEPSSIQEKRSSRSQRLSINLSLLSPSATPSLSSASSTSPPSATYSSSSSAVSSPGGVSPILNSYQWTGDLRQYIMTDIGPQPPNSQIPAVRNQMLLSRRRSYSKIGGHGFVSPTMGGSYKGLGFPTSPTCVSPSTSLQTQALVGQYGNANASSVYSNGGSKYGSMTDLCAIPQGGVPVFDRRMMLSHADWEHDADM
ncbi:hypothetical protein BGZ51_003989 [Haplosporangium sp. Z 767]|nr:hypothetical protein BGZ51_003989 [Haplosporangium sp. Z 767]KAF9186486.1 hypothetical protein BGZ50_002418 [Haplosporangium sp. Z 11]